MQSCDCRHVLVVRERLDAETQPEVSLAALLHGSPEREKLGSGALRFSHAETRARELRVTQNAVHVDRAGKPIEQHEWEGHEVSHDVPRELGAHGEGYAKRATSSKSDRANFSLDRAATRQAARSSDARGRAQGG